MPQKFVPPFPLPICGMPAIHRRGAEVIDRLVMFAHRREKFARSQMRISDKRGGIFRCHDHGTFVRLLIRPHRGEHLPGSEAPAHPLFVSQHCLIVGQGIRLVVIVFGKFREMKAGLNGQPELHGIVR